MSALTVLHNTREQAPTHTHALKVKLGHFVANNNKIREVLTRVREKTKHPVEVSHEVASL